MDATRIRANSEFVPPISVPRLGATGFIYGTRNDLEGFEEQGFLASAGDGDLAFDYHGRHRELLDVPSPADVRWAAERWTALTPDQWRAAFAAARYPPDVAKRYIRKLKQKIAQGLAVQRSFSSNPGVRAAVDRSVAERRLSLHVELVPHAGGAEGPREDDSVTSLGS